MNGGNGFERRERYCGKCGAAERLYCGRDAAGEVLRERYGGKCGTAERLYCGRDTAGELLQ